MEMIQPIRLRLHLDSRSMPTQQVMSLVFFFWDRGVAVWWGCVCQCLCGCGAGGGGVPLCLPAIFFISNLFLSKIT
jgi:hypothetical protein